ncbi:MAG: GGDEF domain-containing protein [Burkholderiaceae bacterium]|jgi:two-component system cell cycle response regulator
MSPAEIDPLALTALRLLPDEPDRAMRLWDDAFARASGGAGDAMARTLLRLRIVKMHHQARFGDRDTLGSPMLAAAAEARAHGWRVESLLVDLLEVYLATLGANHDEGLGDVEAIRAEAEAHLEPIELSWMELMAGHFHGYRLGWAQEPERTYRALNRLVTSPDAPPGLVANVQMNIGHSHLLVGNVDLASTYLQQAWRLYQPLPLTPRKMAAARAWAQCLMAMNEYRRADAVLQEVLDVRAELTTPMFLSGALLVSAEAKVKLGDLKCAEQLLEEAAANADASTEPAVLVHVAYVRALVLCEQGDIAGAAQVGEAGCRLIPRNTHKLGVQSCLDLTARLQAQVGNFQRAYELQCHVVAMRNELAKKSAEVRHVDLHVDHQTHLARMQIEHARRERTIAETAEAAIVQKNQLLQQRLREVERLQESLRELANRDALTGLYNRRYLGEALPGLVSMASRRGDRIVVILIDLDHFKAVNDVYGHQMGDLVLEGFADLVRDGFRAHDLCCRYGGEEFCVVMADTDDIAAHERVEELQERLGERLFTSGDKELTRVGFSAGIVTFKANPRMDLDMVFRRADQALYASKNGGRRQISALELA